MIDMTGLTDSELDELEQAAKAERDRRRLLATAEDQATEMARRVYAALGEDGKPWAQPESWAPYPKGAYASEAGQMYESTHPTGNVWGPPSEHPGLWVAVWPDGAGGWTRTDPDGPQPWDPLREYRKPAAVTLGGETYDLIHVVATPGQRPDDPAMWAVWKVRP